MKVTEAINEINESITSADLDSAFKLLKALFPADHEQRDHVIKTEFKYRNAVNEYNSSKISLEEMNIRRSQVVEYILKICSHLRSCKSPNLEDFQLVISKFDHQEIVEKIKITQENLNILDKRWESKSGEFAFVSQSGGKSTPTKGIGWIIMIFGIVVIVAAIAFGIGGIIHMAVGGFFVGVIFVYTGWDANKKYSQHTHHYQKYEDERAKLLVELQQLENLIK